MAKVTKIYYVPQTNVIADAFKSVKNTAFGFVIGAAVGAFVGAALEYADHKKTKAKEEDIVEEEEAPE